VAGKRKRPDINIGDKFNRLTIIGEPFYTYINNIKYKYWLVVCECNCGNITVKQVNDITNNRRTNSCGCLTIEASITHGVSNHPLYTVWINMKNRCYDPKSEKYPSYGKRGIRMCEEWIQDPRIFIKWAEQNGYEKGLEIDRINNDGNYTPLNCRFVTGKENCNNKSNNHRITYKNETHSMTEWGRILSISRCAIKNRIKYGWSTEEIFETPVGQKRSKKCS